MHMGTDFFIFKDKNEMPMNFSKFLNCWFNSGQESSKEFFSYDVPFLEYFPKEILEFYCTIKSILLSCSNYNLSLHTNSNFNIKKTGLVLGHYTDVE